MTAIVKWAIRGAAALVVIVCSFCLAGSRVFADEVQARYLEGASHGFMILRTPDGATIATGESTQTVSDFVVTNHLVFRFNDGSLYDDTTSFTERGSFRLLSDHLTQTGPAFKTPMETSIDTSTGMVSVRYNKGKKQQAIQRKMDLPPDLGNGMLFAIVKNIRSTPATSVSYLATTPTPEVVSLLFTKEGEDNFRVGNSTRRARRYVMSVQIGGIRGVIARILQKKPPNSQFWVIEEGVPTYAGSEGPLYADGPVWRIELVSASLSGYR